MQTVVMEDNILVGSAEVHQRITNFGQAILDSLNQYPDFIGMIDAETDEKITFAEMQDRSVRCALWLRKQGISENDVVGMSSPIQKHDYVPYLATLFINSIFNSWACDASSAIVHHFLETCRPKVIFASIESIDKLSECVREKRLNCQFIVFEKHLDYQTLDEIMSTSTNEEVENFKCIEPSDPYNKVSAIYLSSGTTGIPKSIMLSYHCISRRYAEEVGLRDGMNCLWHAPLHLNVCRSLLSSVILLRCTRILQRCFDVEETSEIVKKYKVNFIYWSPYYLLSSYRAGVFERNDFPNLTTIAIAGAKAYRTMLEDCQKALPRIFIKNSYGITEAGGLIAQQNDTRNNINSVGFLCSGVQLKVVDPDTGRVLGPNQEGELHVKTDTVMLGYFGDPEKTRQTIDKDGWLHTGDLGSYDEDGEVTVSGRIKQIIRTKSYLLSSNDFEEPLMQHPDVSECAVVAVTHPIDIERPFAFVVKARDAKVTAEELIEFSARKNEIYRLTGGLVFVDALPYTPSGKKCIKILQEMAKMYYVR